jgi:hypothetical protein
VFSNGCNYCLCMGDGTVICTALGCTAPIPSNDPANPRCDKTDDPWCIYDQGCQNPQGTVSHARCSGTWGVLPFCGCDGKTFRYSCPLRPYKHPGECR